MTFVHPISKAPLERDPDGNLKVLGGPDRATFTSQGGVFDFSATSPGTSEARTVYDQFYAVHEGEPVTFKTAEEAWHDGTVPWRQTMLKSLGDLNGKVVLLLGSGDSYKEFHFLRLGARLILTDLSLVAVQRARAVFQKSEFWRDYQHQIEFHAVDASHLPFPNSCLDVIYGSKVVGFLESVPDFLLEVHRCLKPGGICRFADDAESPVWECLRRWVVLPVKKAFVETKSGDLTGVRSASRFGINRQAIEEIGTRIPFSRILFIREYFLLRALQLVYGKLVRWDPNKLKYIRPALLGMKWIDSKLLSASWMKRNALSLTWGLDK